MSFTFLDDWEESSPDGRFVCEARSPRNGRVEEEGHDRLSWRLRLYEGSQLLWERWMRVSDSPSRIEVDDTGWVVVTVSYAHACLIALSPDGDEAVRMGVLWPGSQEREGYTHRHVTPTTGGLDWDFCSLRFFFSGPEGVQYVVRTLWGDTLILEPEHGRWTLNPAGSAVEGAARKEVLARLGRGEPLLCDSALAEVIRKPFPSAVALMRRMEQAEGYGNRLGGSSCDHTGYRLEASDHAWFLRLALRRCGEVPTGSAAFRIVSDGPVAQPERVPERDSLWSVDHQLRTWRDAVSLYGAPDSVAHVMRRTGELVESAEVWQYFSGTGEEIFIHQLRWKLGTNGEELETRETLKFADVPVGDRLVALYEQYA